jgi:hypothetical protein
MGKTRSIIWSIVVVLMLCAGTGQASRVLVMPTADGLAERSFELDYVYHGGRHDVLLQLGVHPNFSAGLKQEVGGPLYAVVKAVLAPETAERPGLALGGELSVARQDLYAVVSKQLGAPHIRGHLALGLGRYSRGMAGVTFMLNPVKVSNVPTTSLFFEYDGQDVAGGVTAQFSPELKTSLSLSLGHGLSVGMNFKMEF